MLVLREVEHEFVRLRGQLDGKDKAIALQGNRIVTHLVVKRLGGFAALAAAQNEASRSALIDSVADRTRTSLESLTAAVADLFPQNYVTSLFKNATRCAELVDEIDS